MDGVDGVGRPRRQWRSWADEMKRNGRLMPEPGPEVKQLQVPHGSNEMDSMDGVDRISRMDDVDRADRLRRQWRSRWTR